MIEPYEVYKLYLAIKLHFTTKSYDVVKYKGKVRVTPETFRKRKDMVSIKKLARDYKREEIIDFLVANFVSGERWGGLFDIQASKRYEDWKVKKNQREYLFKRDVSKIVLEMEKQKVGAFFEKNGKINKPKNYRITFFEKNKSFKTPVYKRNQLVRGQTIRGPAIIEQMDSTAIIFPKDIGKIDNWGNLIISTNG